MDKINECLSGKELDYILPFLWLHGESHEELREEILAIKKSGCNSFCAESRPYPDFCGDKWWEDFGFILKTAKELDMHVWLLDDKRFPTGFAGGIIEDGKAPIKKLLYCEKIDVLGPMKDAALLYENHLTEGDSLICAVAYKRTGNGLECEGDPIDLTATAKDGLIWFDIPDGMWRVFFLIESRRGPQSWGKYHIDMLDPASTDLMISQIYEGQYQHFSEYFGNTFKGFFSDEPGFLNAGGNYFEKPGKGSPIPWRSDLPSILSKKLGISENEVMLKLPSMFAIIGDDENLRVAYMDTVSAIYAENFTKKLGDWCRAHGVEYIGHTIEDMGSCSRLGHSAGHYFRALDAQDMAGIDVVLHQIMPGQNDMLSSAPMFEGIVDPEFFVYALAKLASSHCHINPRMKGRAMCEIFGAYGYAEGLPFMKKLADYMLSSGINRFVPHAFSPKYPDPDCPPHFYSKGNNPQFEGFGMLIRYMQRVIHVFEDSKHIAPVALYYNAECEWAGDETDTYYSVAKMLTRDQIDFDFVSEDHLSGARCENGRLAIEKNTYERLILPGCRYITDRMRKILGKFKENGVKFAFRGTCPEGFEDCILSEIPRDIKAASCSPYLRYNHVKRDGLDIYMFKNDSEEPVNTSIEGLPSDNITVYDAWNNCCFTKNDNVLTLDGGESVIWIIGQGEKHPVFRHPMTMRRSEAELTWNIAAGEKTYVNSPLVNISKDQPRFSGKIEYNTKAYIPSGTTHIDLGCVGETARLTVNGTDCGSCISAPYLFDISGAVKDGENEITVEVVNNPGYYERDDFSRFMKLTPSGILGPVRFMN